MKKLTKKTKKQKTDRWIRKVAKELVYTGFSIEDIEKMSLAEMLLHIQKMNGADLIRNWDMANEL